MSDARIAGLSGTSVVSATHDTARFEAELRPLIPVALRLAAGMLLDAPGAEDAVQEAAFHAWRKQGNRHPGTPLGPWFLAIVANRCRDSRRSRWSRVLRFADPPDGGNAPPGPDPSAAADVRAALRRLPRNARLAMVLRFYLDLPYDEVAAILGCTTDAAKARVRRAAAAMEPTLRVPEKLR